MSVHYFSPVLDPQALVEHPQLEPEVKRAILASWASDRYTVRSQPRLRKPPELPQPVPVQDLLSALARLDRMDGAA